MGLPVAGQLGMLAIATIATLVTYRWLLGRHTAPSSRSVHPARKATKGSRTFRVRGVPLGWDADRLQSFLAGHESSAGATVKSLAHEIHRRSRIATVTFQNVPSQLESLRTGQTWSISLPNPSENQPVRSHPLTLDDDFLGITTLYTPPLEDHRVDIIAVSGLGGHAFGSFKERNGGHMWLRDSLPYDITREDTDDPIARVMIYGYESSVAQSKSMQNLEDLATSFHNSLLALASSPTIRPIILIAHSLGGLIVKQTLISLSKSKNEDDIKLIQAVYGIVFFGVPHDGMDISSLIPMVGDGPNRFLIESIGRINPQILSIQQREFHTALGREGDSEIFCFYETVESPTAQKYGNWAMTGLTAVLVTKSSATHCRSWEDGPEHICAVARTHSDMVKFGPQDHEYDNARERLKGLARRALTVWHRIQASDAKFLVPYEQNRNFVKRSKILKDLKLQLGFGPRKGAVKGAVEPRSRVSLYGLGGVGKTQIAIAYVYWLRQTCPDVSVFWVYASNAERFHQAYSSIAQECDIPGYDDPKVNVLSLVKTWLETKYRSRWLMVIDNADDTELFFRSQQGGDKAHPSPSPTNAEGNLSRYIPKCAYGSILITTRNKQAGLRLAPGERPIEVSGMTDSEADQLVRAMLEGDEVTAKETPLLVARLGHLPLALAQAAAFIQENTISIGEYIQLLAESDSALVDRLSEPFETVGRDSDTPHALTATWIISFEQIERRHSLTSDILSLISLFDRQAIPKDFVADYWHRRRPKESEAAEASEAADITKVLGTLKAFSFISEGKDRTVDMHRLVQLVTRKWLVNKGKMAEFTQHALGIVSDAYPYGQFENREVCLKYLPHADAVLETKGTGSRDERIGRATLLHCVGSYFLYQGRWKDAEKYQTRSVKLREEIFGEEHRDTLSSMASLASTFWNQGRWKEAEDIEVRVMETRKRVLGEEHPDTLTSMANLASTYRNQGRWKEAEELQAKELEICSRVVGEEHPSTLSSMANLASTYWNQGRWKEAEDIEVRVMETRKRVLGEEHPSTLSSMANLASTYRNQGRWKEAEDIDVRVMETTKRVLGEEHPSTLSSMANLASTYRNQGRWKEAEELQAQELEICSRVVGEEHPSTLTSMANLASTYWNQGRWKEAEDIEVRVMETRKRVLGEEHPSTLSSMANLASTYRNQGRWKEAEELQAQELEICSRVVGEEHPSTLTSMANLASTYWNQGRWKEAEDIEVRVMETRKRVVGEEHPSTLSSMANLASTYRNQGRWKEAEDIDVRVMETTKRVLGEEHPSTLSSMANLASTYRNQGRWKEAEELQAQELEICSRVVGEEHPSTLTSMANLASTYWNQGRWKEAEDIEVRVMETRKRVLGEEHPSTLSSMANLAMTWKDQGGSGDALALMRKCVSLRERVLGPDHPDTVSSLTTLARWQE
ncbi:hypothetical protein B0J13DRAFT_153463 [Dactylonectria estremocensis]|uniref:DUF676 domain-containing protein n=1 Tax=Dactylonectria estremocensis TaxID=1079267 RepID=A0A9P9DMG0_9HYPO|nr:hypothetical protein B0J13DRAFT_153463 [Dactylonectria estremocensis]